MAREKYCLENEGIWFNELMVKVVTYDNLYYTLNIHSKEEIEDRKKNWEEDSTESYTYDQIIDSFVAEDLNSIISRGNDLAVQTTDDGLIYLTFENKLLNRREIKESVIQYK